MKRLVMLFVALTIWATPAQAQDVTSTPVAISDVVVVTPAVTVEGEVPAEIVRKPVTPEDIDEIVENVTLLIQLFKNGQWSLAIGLLLTLLVMVFRKFFEKYIPKKALPWVAVILGVISSVAVGLSAGVLWWKAILQGFAAGATAAGLWELIFKHLKKKPEETPA